MATVDTFASFRRRVDVFVDGLSDPELRKVMARLGDAAKADANKAAEADLGGDNKFSGWARAPLDTEYKHQGEGQIEVRPTSRARGPWRVAESGRNRLGASGGFQGPAINRRTGATMRTKTGKFRNSRARARRWNGITAPKHTWSDAEKLIEKATPDRVETEVARAKRKAFGY